MAVNSTAEVSMEGDRLVTIGNPTEVALLKWMHKNGPDYTVYREESVILEQKPFSPETKYMQTVAVIHEGEAPVRFVKGAPEIVLEMCDSIAGGQTKEHILSLIHI